MQFPYFSAYNIIRFSYCYELHIKTTTTRIIITITSRTGCVKSHNITNKSTRKPIPFPNASRPEKSPLQAAAREPNTNNSKHAKICITATSYYFKFQSPSHHMSEILVKCHSPCRLPIICCRF